MVSVGFLISRTESWCSEQLAGDEERPGGKLLPDAGQLSALLDTSNSSQWTADTMHANMAEVRLVKSSSQYTSWASLSLH